MILKATKDRILVLPEPPVQQEGRFWVQNLLPSNQGVVVSTGPDVKDVEKGMRISFKPFSGSDLEYQGKQYRVVQPEDVLLLLD